jgi:hypothetical protein
MAVDPTQLAEDQEARQRITAAGAPTEFAKGPEQEGFQVAGLGARIIDALRPAPPMPAPPKKPAVPTPQEMPLVDETFDEEAAKRSGAAELLSPEGQAEFEARGLKAVPNEREQAVREAREAIDATASDEFTEIEELRAAREEQNARPEYDQVIDDANKAIEGEAPEVSPLEDVVLPEIDVQAKSITEGGDFNLENMKTSEDVGKLITAVSEVSKLEVDQAKRFKLPNNVTKENAAELLADELGFTKRFLERRIEDGLLTAEELVAAREIFVAQGEKIMDLAAKINTGVSTPKEKLEFRRQLAIYHGFHLHLKGFQSETARALQSFAIEVGGEEGALAMARNAREALAQLGGGEGMTDEIAKAAASVLEEKGTGGLARFINKVAFAKTREAIAEAYMAGLLTSPATNFKNIISNAAWMTYQIPAETLAGIYGTAIRTGRKAAGLSIDPDQVYIEDSALRLKGYYDSFGDALKVASLAFKTEKPSVKARAEIEDYSTGVRLSDETPLSGPINFIFKGVRLPFRALLFGDEFFKTISQRGELYVQANKAYRRALYEGKDITEAADEAGMILLDPSSVGKELDLNAKYNTLQDDTTIFGMDISAPGTAIQRLNLGPLPIGQWLMPFVKTPTSGAIKTMEMSGINPEVYRDLISGTPKQQQKAMAKLTMAGAAFGFVHNKVSEGRMTGAMPMDKVAREALPPGWQPYSFVYKGEGFPEGVDELYNDRGIPNGPLTYVSYAGWEPVGGILAFMTTANEAVYGNDIEGVGNRALAAVGSIAGYYGELPMLQGLADVSTVLDNDTLAGVLRDAPHILRGPIEGSSVGGFPNIWSSAQRMGFRTADPTVRNPFGDFDYYTLEEVEQTNEDGSWKYPHPNGVNPDYRLVGREKLGRPVTGGQAHVAEEMSLLLEKIKSMRAKDSFFQDEEDYNAVKRDTLGRPYGAEDVSFATNPKLALWNNFTGIRVRPAEAPTNVELELMRLYETNKQWALSNPKSYDGMKLSFRAQMDLVNEAKNNVKIKIPGLGGRVNFQEALENLTTKKNTRQGRMYSDDMKRFGDDNLVLDAKRFALIKDLEKQFYDRAWQIMMTDPSYQSIPYYAKLRQAYDDRAVASEKLREKGMLSR